MNFFIAVKLFDYSCFTSGSFNLCNCRRGEGVCLYLDSGSDFSVSENLYEFSLGCSTCSDESLRSELLEAELLAESLEGGNVNGTILYAGRVLEAELGKTALDRHLATFESDLVLVTCTGLCTLGTTGSSATLTGTLAAADALCVMGCALCGLQIFKFHLSYLLSQLLRR